LIPLQEYAVQIAHAVKTSLSSIKDIAEFFKENYPNPKYESIFKDYASIIYEEMYKLAAIVMFMLSYAQVKNDEFVLFSPKNIIENLFYRVNQFRFQNESIDVSVEIQDCSITGHTKFFEEIIQQLIENAIKALHLANSKQIRCSGYVKQDTFYILFSDNGCGIAKENKNRIFDLYFTTTTEHGGTGIGLYMTKQRVETFKGNIEVIENEFKPSGATFRITIPLTEK
jgi:signal transduction histidine kinase